jgi:hypothetical protein
VRRDEPSPPKIVLLHRRAALATQMVALNLAMHTRAEAREALQTRGGDSTQHVLGAITERCTSTRGSRGRRGLNSRRRCNRPLTVAPATHLRFLRNLAIITHHTPLKTSNDAKVITARATGDNVTILSTIVTTPQNAKITGRLRTEKARRQMLYAVG